MFYLKVLKYYSISMKKIYFYMHANEFIKVNKKIRINACSIWIKSLSIIFGDFLSCYCFVVFKK